MGCTIGIVDAAVATEGRPNLRIRMTSNALMVKGEVELLSAIQDLLAELGYEWDHAADTRIDLCVDLVGVTIEDFYEPYVARHVIKRARKASTVENNDKIETLKVGMGDVQVRIYNKLVEAAKNPEKFAIMMNHRWGGNCEGGATRVEFQLRGDAIKEILGTNDHEVVSVSMPKLIEYLTDSWFRMTDGPVDRENKHQSRAETSPLWKQVIQHFVDWAGEFKEAMVRPIRQIKVTTKQLEQQLSGLMAAVLARSCSAESLDPVAALRECHVVITRVLESIADKYEDKRQQLKFTSAVGPPIDLAMVPF